MASLSAKIRRFQIILQCLEKGVYSKKELMDRFEEEGFEIAGRTFERDLEELRRDFNLEVFYDARQNGYTLQPDSKDTKRLQQVLELNQEAQVLQASFFSDATLRDRIQFEPFAGKGTENLDMLMKAINEERKLQFRHFNYQREQYTLYEVLPLMLKEYARRWYLYAYVEDRADCRTFGLDRIDYVKKLHTTFDRQAYIRYFDQFSQVIGVTFSEGRHEETVLLRCTLIQSRYMDSAPWHSSMKRLKEDASAVWYEMQLIPNHELKQKILATADQLEVMEPQWLREEIATLLKEMIEKYRV